MPEQAGGPGNMSERQVYLHLVTFSFSFQSELGQVSCLIDGPIVALLTYWRSITAFPLQEVIVSRWVSSRERAEQDDI